MPIAMMVAAVTAGGAQAAQTKPLTLEDIMTFETLQKPVISDNGKVVAVEAKPDRGDSRALVTVLGAEQKRYELANASAVQTSSDGNFVFAMQKPTLLESKTLDKKQQSTGLVLLNTQTGDTNEFKNVKSAKFSYDGKVIAIVFEPQKDDAKTKDKSDNADDKPQREIEEADKGSGFSVIELASNKRFDFDHVTGWVFDDASKGMVIAINDGESQLHQVQWLDLVKLQTKQVFTSKTQQIGELAISSAAQKLAFTYGSSDTLRWGREYQLSLIDLASVKAQKLPTDKDWVLNQFSTLKFSKDGERLFFGRVPQVTPQAEIVDFKDEKDLLDRNIIVGKRDLRIWHGEDPKIKPHEIKEYQEEREKTFAAVLHINANRIVQLATRDIPDVEYGEQKRFLVASSNVPYQKMTTWAGFYRDFYLVDLNTGQHTLVIPQQSAYAQPTLSPNAKFMAYYQQGHVYLYDIATGRKHNLTAELNTPFANEDHDYPSPAPGYGFGPWLEDDTEIVVYDKYDAWQFNTVSHRGFMITNGLGREQQIEFRLTGLVEQDGKDIPLIEDQALLLKGYSHKTKADSFYMGMEGESGVKIALETNGKLEMLARAKDTGALVYSSERYDQYPDLYVADFESVAQSQKITNLDAQRDAFAWGNAELVHWRDGHGRQSDGVLIKPINYQEGKKYPVLVYFYRFMSDRLHAFPDMKINHRPNFAWFAQNGYAVFLPDVRFDIGYPGPSSVQALTAGVQKLIDMGIADPDAIGIQGHSWAGYQTAYAVTQTHIFKAAVSGAPVSNMTSAYSGIRHGSGLARQFQYETGQSRIGQSLFNAPLKYIENSPVFYADRIETPMMIMFGDKDDAVPWEQGVEMYLAMRRAGKDVVFLQYQDEPHHLKKYPNKLDYSIRMMEYFDHYLKGKDAPTWLTQGEAYQEYRAND
ncbi:S9 family peptidase [Shewanella sp. WXL01]|uniref:S9 family peptidase n=1 Tax=Shewanella sp. WXL01 TaxID=2709721 RepID=UPI0014385F91|nr:prolyl oligopeptidase family serine peptidase [Shewanella sp. WXL01]NKF50140.1 S9 family peptidase [Shewanella sp. WXL01]